MINNEDKVAQIMDEWYDAMATNKIMVQPKASTILGIILAKYLSDGVRDIWAEALTKRGGEFMDWYKDLSPDEQDIYHARLSEAPTNADLVNKQLLKG